MFNLSTDSDFTNATIHHYFCNFDSNKGKKGLQVKKPAALGNMLEAATGFEPVNNGFADRCLSHLAMPP